MTKDVEVGDWATPRLIVKPFDGATTATVEIHGNDGQLVGAPPATPQGVDPETGGQIWLAEPYRVTDSGVWRETWHVEGTGAGEQTRRFYVSPTPGTGSPAWSPPPWKPADYVPGRTLVPVDTGGNVPVDSFDATTRPTGVQVERLTSDAVAWVIAACGQIAVSLYDMASATAAVWVAAQIERGYPDRVEDMTFGNNLFDQAIRMREDLQRANEAATGTDPADPNAGLLPMWSFPSSNPLDAGNYW